MESRDESVRKDYTIQPGHLVLFRLPSEEIKPVKLDEKSQIHLGKFGSFPARNLIDQPYGVTYEIIQNQLQITSPAPLEEVDDTDATNELINDSEDIQLMNYDQVEALKQSGAHVKEIIDQQISQHSNFTLKTEYSKEKYKKRKAAKFSKSFTTIEPTIHNICAYWFQKDQLRLRDIRHDTLAQMIALANVRPGGNFLVVDDAMGMIIAAVLDRLQGYGRLIALCDVESQPVYHVLEYMNFDRDIVEPVLRTLNWANADETYSPVLPTHSDTLSDDLKTERQKARMTKRKVAAHAMLDIRHQLFMGGFDGLIIASQHDSFSIVQRLSPFLVGSASIVIHCPNIQPLAEVQARMRECPQYLSPSIVEPWMRRYQVLPGRTHPFMTSTGSGGFVLHATKIYPDIELFKLEVQRREKLSATLSHDSTGDSTPKLDISGAV